ncbi:hypothetical protein ACFOEN_16670 [Piscinibacterium candidicorallinum]|uniref:Uncharacterized protein n=2 Tax=Piscinibacterium candidicorallinum TaxID=1793872 RepID=A0ABV7H9P5_9BURK
MGELCGHLYVLFDDPILSASDERTRRFIADHEAFHIAAQMYGAKVPIVFVGDRPQIEAESRSFLRNLERVLNASSLVGVGDAYDSVCALLEKYHLHTSSAERQALSHWIFWEWPAEDYAFRMLRKNHHADIEDYLRIRTLLGDSEVYALGPIVGMALDQMVGQAVWQHRIQQGETMLDVLVGSCTSGRGNKEYPTIEMSRVTFEFVSLDARD